MLNLVSTEMKRNPYPTYAALRGTPVMHVPGVDLWLLLDYDTVKRALTDHERFSSNAAPTRNITFEWLLFMDPPRHTQLRALVNKAFTPRSIAALEPRITAISRELLDAQLDRGEMDVVADYAAPLPLMVLAELVGFPVEDWPRLRRWSEAIMNLADTIAGSADAAKRASDAFNRANDEMKLYLDELRQLRARAPRDDLFSRLVAAEIDGQRLGEDEILRFVQLLIAAGTETTTNLIDNALLELMEHPGELARIEASASLLPSAIEEVLRHRSPAQAMFRATKMDVEIGGQTIPAGKMVLTMLGAANRDPRVFVDADKFDVTREPNPHLAFGHGIHYCIGAPLSRLEARVALHELLARARDFVPASDEPWAPRQPFHVHGPASLPVRFRKR